MCNCSSAPCACEELTIPLGPRGYNGPPGITPTLIFSATTLAAGSPATVTQTGGPATYNIQLGLPTGATGTGTPGRDTWSTLTAGFTQPALGDIVNVTGVDFRWMSVGEYVYVAGGGYYQIFTVSGGGTSAQLRNPGTIQGFPSGVPGNASPGASIGNGALIGPSGVPGTAGATGATGSDGTPGTPGTPGTDAELLVTYTNPVAAPSPGRSSVIYTDSASNPTFTVIKSYAAGAWTTRANIQGAAGTIIVSTNGDPNTTLPAGPIGTYAVRTDVPSMYAKTGVSTWAFVVSLTPTFTQVATASSGDMGTVPVSTQSVVGFVTNSDTFGVPGVYTFDLQYQSIDVKTNVDIELDWDDTAYGENAHWFFTVENTNGSPINLTLTTGQWIKKTGLTIPATIAASASQAFLVYRYGNKLLIADTFVTVAA